MVTPSDKTVAIMTGALKHAAGALSQFLGDRVLNATDVQLSNYSLLDLPTLYGPEETPVACAAFEVNEDLQGFLVLLLPLDQADHLLQTLLGSLGSPDDETLANSVFGELGNVVSSAFLNHVADGVGMRITLSPPHVSRDMVGALLGTLAGALADARGAKLPVVHTELAGNDGQLSAYLLWIPGELDLQRLEAPF